jgi:hypothetical protein
VLAFDCFLGYVQLRLVLMLLILAVYIVSCITD